MVSLVVLNYNDFETTSAFLKSIENYNSINHIVVVDNMSPDGSYEKLIGFSSPKIDVISSGKNGGYGYGNNIGIKYLKDKYNSDICIICNPDVEFDESTVIKVENVIRGNPEVAIAAPVMVKPDSSVCTDTAWEVPKGWQYVLLTCQFPFNKLAKSIYYSIDELTSNNLLFVGAVAGSMLMIRIEDFLEVGGYDENVFLYGEENILGVKLANRNKITVLVTEVKFIHRHSVSISKSIPKKNKQRNLMIKSRVYSLGTYYNFSSLEICAAKLLIMLSDVLIKPINCISRIRKKQIA